MSDKVQEYVHSVDGDAHQSAVKIIKDLESRLAEKDKDIERMRAVVA